MRKTILILVTLALLMLSACVPETPPPPQGVWKSEYPEIILYIMPEYQVDEMGGRFLAKYTAKDGSHTKAIVRFLRGSEVGIYGLADELYQDRRNSASFSATLLVGFYRVEGDEMNFTLNPRFQEERGISSIKFIRLEKYEPIDPRDWLPNLFPRAEISTLEQ